MIVRLDFAIVANKVVFFNNRCYFRSSPYDPVKLFVKYTFLTLGAFFHRY